MRTLLFIIALLASSPANSKTDYPVTSFIPAGRVVMQVNNINTSFWNNGIFNRAEYGFLGGGLLWPANSPSVKTLDYSTGIWIGAKVGSQRELRLAAAFYESHYSPGNIPVIGQVPPQSVCNDPSWKPYLVNLKDQSLVNGGTRNKVAGGVTFTIVYDSWANWPVSKGAPYVEVNNIPGYQPGWNSDRPGIGHTTARPDEISFMVYMDYTNCTSNIHQASMSNPGGTLPLGAEIQQISFAFNRPGYTNMYFVKWKVRNRSSMQWDSTYFSIADDADVGNAFDDAAGCDSVKQLGIVYNGDNLDPDYGAAPPALGYSILECPINYTGNNSDTAHLPYGSFAGYKLLKMSGYNTFKNGGGPCDGDPDHAINAYNFMRGKDGCGNTIINTATGNPTTFRNNGVCNLSPGWFDSVYTDKRQILSTGPLTMNPGDERMFAAAVIVGKGSDNLQSVMLICALSDYASRFYLNSFGGDPIGINPISSEVPEQFALYQNYPNPFNPVTRIRFALPPVVGLGVRLIIYDLLGREVETVVNEELTSGAYEVSWDATGYPSGIYFYTLLAGNFISTKKMVLLK